MTKAAPVVDHQRPRSVVRSVTDLVTDSAETFSTTVKIGNEGAKTGLNLMIRKKQRSWVESCLNDAIWEQDMKSQYGEEVFANIPPCPY